MLRNLLVADDSVTIRKAIEIAFTGDDWRVRAEPGGEAALRAASAERPDVVLADVAMPGMDGYELCRAVKGDPSLAGVPVLLLAGPGCPVDEDRAREAGADGVVAKPFDCASVVARVGEALGGAPAARPFVPPAVAPVPASPPMPPVPAPRPVVAPAAARRTVPPPLPPPGHPLRVAAARVGVRPPAVPPLPAPPLPAPPAPGLRPVVDDDWTGVASPPVAVEAPAVPPAPAAPPAPVAVPAPVSAATDGGEAALRLALSQASREVVEKIAWEVVPQLAEVILREHVERLVDDKKKR